jgi:hypothetical protein
MTAATAARKLETRNRKIEIRRSNPERELRDVFAPVAAGFGTRGRQHAVPPPRVFSQKSVDLLDCKGVDVFERNREFAIV